MPVRRRGRKCLGKDAAASGVPSSVTPQPSVVPPTTAVTRQVRDRFAYYQLLAERARDIVLVVGQPDGRIIEANQAAVTAYGYSQAELLRHTIHDLRAVETRLAVPAQMAQANADGALFETVHCRKDGTCFPVEVSAVGTTLDGQRVIVSIIRDVSARKEAETALARWTRHLEMLRDVTEEVTRELDLTRLLRLITARAMELLHAPDGGLFVWHPEAERLVPEVWITDQVVPADFSVRMGESLTGLVAQERRGRIVNHYRTWSAANPVMLRDTRAEAAIAMPLLYRDTLLGVLALADCSPGRAFADADADVLRLFADQGAIAIANARLFQEERERGAQLEALRATTSDLAHELDLTRLLRLLIARAAELVGAASATVYLWEPAEALVIPAAWHGLGDYQATIRHRLGQGVAGTVAQTRRGLIVNDYRNSRYTNPVTLERTAITAALGEPLEYREELIGAITLNHTGGRTFTAQDQALVRLFATPAAIAIANARLFEAERDRRAQLEALRATTADLTSELDLAKLLQLLIERAVTLLQGVSGAVYLVDSRTELITPEAWIGHGGWLETVRLHRGEGIAGTIIEHGCGLIENAYRTSPYAVRHYLEHTTHTAVLGEPLRYRDRILGAVLVDRRDAVFTPQDRDLLRLFVDQAAIAIENARLYTAAQQALTDLQQAQDELVRAEKLRGLGQMAAGIAHDLNNTLATVLGQAELLRLQHALSPAVQEGLELLQTAANDGAVVVRRLQDFAGQRGAGPLGPCDLSRVVPEALELTRPRWREEPRRKGTVIEAVLDLAGLPLIQANPAEIREVLTNLIFNAVDAMPTGGSLRFVGRVCAGSEDRSLSDAPALPSAPESALWPHSGPWVELAVSDTGIGMTDAVRRRAFDPFFTTKGFHGTGLGLSVVYGIMERHGGRIELTSAPGQGTTVSLRFRPVSEAAQSPTTRSAPPSLPPRRVLLVDDDASVRRTLAGLLRASGHNVLEAESGAAALRALETEPVDLVFTDLGMPEVTGWDVARAAKARRPDLPVILLTGWGDQVAGEAPADTAVDRVLTKPVPRSTVLGVIADLTGQD